MSNKLSGCFSALLVVIGIVVCLWLMITSGLGQAILENKPVRITIPNLFNNARPAQAQGETSHMVMNPPTLSAAFINKVLAQAHSPAAGTGQALYTLSKRYGVDDVYALAFFKHESSYGTSGVARFTRSLGNIRCSPGYHCLDGFRAYTTWIQGYQDWYALIRTLYVDKWHLVTVEQIIPIYAPASNGNDPASYIAAVNEAVSTWRRGEV